MNEFKKMKKVLDLQSLSSVSGGKGEPQPEPEYEIQDWSTISWSCPTVRQTEWSTLSGSCVRDLKKIIVKA